MAESFVNIQFPFSDDTQKNYFLKMNKTRSAAIKSNLVHLLLTNKGERYYMPDFGTNLRQFLFEQNDDITSQGIIGEINQSINKFIPNLIINNITVTKGELNDYSVTVRLDYTITENTFTETDFVTLQL